MCLVPVYLGTSQRAAWDPNRGNALELTPATAPILPAQPRNLPDRRPGRDGLDVGDWPDDIDVVEVHLTYLASSVSRSRPTGIWNVYFRPLRLGRLHERRMRIEDEYGRLSRHA